MFHVTAQWALGDFRDVDFRKGTTKPWCTSEFDSRAPLNPYKLGVNVYLSLWVCKGRHWDWAIVHHSTVGAIWGPCPRSLRDPFELIVQQSLCSLSSILLAASPSHHISLLNKASISDMTKQSVTNYKMITEKIKHFAIGQTCPGKRRADVFGSKHFH